MLFRVASVSQGSSPTREEHALGSAGATRCTTQSHRYASVLEGLVRSTECVHCALRAVSLLLMAPPARTAALTKCLSMGGVYVRLGMLTIRLRFAKSALPFLTAFPSTECVLFVPTT